MIKFDKNEFLKPQIYSTLDEYESRCNVTKEIIEEIEQLQQENQKYKEVIDNAIEYINDNLTISSILDGEKYYTINNYSFDYKELLDILKVKE